MLRRRHVNSVDWFVLSLLFHLFYFPVGSNTIGGPFLLVLVIPFLNLPRSWYAVTLAATVLITGGGVICPRFLPGNPATFSALGFGTAAFGGGHLIVERTRLARYPRVAILIPAAVLLAPLAVGGSPSPIDLILLVIYLLGTVAFLLPRLHNRSRFLTLLAPLVAMALVQSALESVGVGFSPEAGTVIMSFHHQFWANFVIAGFVMNVYVIIFDSASIRSKSQCPKI